MILEIHDPMRKLDGPSSENVSCTDNLILICVTVIDIFKTSCSLRYETIAKWNHVTLFQQGERTAVWPTHVKSNIWDLKFPPLRHLGLKKKRNKGEQVVPCWGQEGRYPWVLTFEHAEFSNGRNLLIMGPLWKNNLIHFFQSVYSLDSKKNHCPVC